MVKRVSPEALRAGGWALGATVLLGVSIIVGSRNLAHFDAALVAYTFAVLFATFGLTYRYSMWLQRPPTAVYWRRGWRAFFQRGRRRRNAGSWIRRVGSEVLANRFIFARGWVRGLTHMLSANKMPNSPLFSGKPPEIDLLDSLLGIYGGGKVQTIFDAVGDVPVLRSRAASVFDTWSIPGKSFKTVGGDIQLFAPDTSLLRPR